MGMIARSSRRIISARRLAAVDVRTTVLTSTLAALAGDSILAGGDNHHMGRRAGSVLSMLSGAAIGAVLLRFGLAVPLGVGGVLVLASTCAYAWLSPPTPARASGEKN